VAFQGLLSDAERKVQSRRKGGALGTALIAAVLVGLSAAGSVGCAPAPTAAVTGGKAQDPVPVTVETVSPRAVQRAVHAVGTLGGYDEVTLAPKVDGRIFRVNFDVGDPVMPGAVLLSLDPTDYRLAMVEAKRSRDAELARLGWTALPTG